MNLTKTTKQELYDQMVAAKAEAAESKAAVQVALNAANMLNGKLGSIEGEVLKLSFFKPNGKINLWTILANWKLIVAFLEFVVNAIKEAKQQLQDIIDKSNNGESTQTDSK